VGGEQVNCAPVSLDPEFIAAQLTQPKRSLVQFKQTAPSLAHPPTGVAAMMPFASHPNVILLATQALSALICDTQLG
jgi:hypothetical protein